MHDLPGLKVTGLLLLLAAVAGAQETRSTVFGTVTDSSGAAVSGAGITAIHGGTNLRVTASSQQNGYYALPSLPPGPYEISAEAPGFRKFIRRGVTLNAGDKVTVDIRLEVGAVSESVTVTAELSGIETNQSVMGQLMDNKRVSELPLNGRSFLMLLQLSAGVVFTQQQFGVTGWSGTRQWETGPGAGPFTMHGGRPATNAFLLDGAPLGVEGGATYVPLVDAIDEFKVVAPTSDASQGLSGGGVMAVTMKSGTNQLHGLASHFIRNRIFDANTTQTNRAAAQRPDLKKQQHQWNNFAAMLSGPIIRNKFFYTGNYDGFRQRVPFPVTVTVPTLDQRAGDFSRTFNSAGQLVQVFDPLTTRQDGNRFVRDPLPGNRLPASRINPISANFLQFFPTPNIVTNAVTNFNNYASAPNVGRYRYDSYYVKFDYLWNERHRTFVSENQHWGTEYRATNGLPQDNPGVTGANPFHRVHSAATVDHVYAVNPTTVLNARLAWDRFNQYQVRSTIQQFDGSTLGFQNRIGSNPVSRFPSLTFTDYITLGNTGPTNAPDDVYTVVVDLSRTLNRHLIKVGMRAFQTRFSRFQPAAWWGQFSFDKAFTQRDPQRGDATSGNAMASFLLGYPGGGGTDTNPHSTFQRKTFGIYVQDDLKVNAKLTLNLGLRWDIQTAPTERFNRIIRAFDPNVTYQLGEAQARGGLLFADKDHRQAWSTNFRDFQPRFGLAYQAMSRMVVRAGYGISYLPLTVGTAAGTALQTGYARRTPFVATTGGGVNSYIPGLPGTGTFANPFPDGILQPFGSDLGPKTQVGQAVTFQNSDYVVPRVHQFHFGIDFQLPWNTNVEASYVGTRTRKYPVTRNLNSISLEERLAGVDNPTYLTASVPNPFAGAPELVGTGRGSATISRAQALLPFPQFGNINNNTLSVGTTSYNALEMRVNRRMARGLVLTGSYTLAKTIEALAYREPQYTALTRVLAGFDRTHHLTAFALYELPLGRGKRFGANWGPGLDLLLGGWQYNISLEHMTGTPTTLPDATPVRDPRLKDGTRDFNRWFNTCTLMSSGARANCASPDEPVAWVQLKPNELRTYSTRFPNLRNHWRPQVNMSVFKSFPIREKARLEFRAEAFNAFNTPMYPAPNTNLTSAQFGLVTLDQQNFPRNMQFALRLKF